MRYNDTMNLLHLQPQQNGGLSTVREAPPPPAPKEDTKPKRGANLTEVEGRATGAQPFEMLSHSACNGQTSEGRAGLGIADPLHTC